MGYVENSLQVVSYFETIKGTTEKFNKDFTSFKRYSFVKNTQAQHFQNSKVLLKEGDVFCRVDSAENASLVAQEEIQRAR